MDRKWWSLIGLVGLVALLCDNKGIKTGNMSGLRRTRARRLFYISNGKVIPRSEVNTAKKMTRAGYGKVFAVWAYNADEAREYIRQGKAESVSGLRGLTLFGVDTFKKGDRVMLKTRYGDVPVGAEGTITKVWTDPNTNTQWGRVFYGKNLTGQRLQQSYPLSVFRNLSRSKTLPEQTSFTDRSQMTLFGGLSGDYDTREKLDKRFDIVEEILNFHNGQMDAVKYVVDRKTGLIEGKVDFSVYKNKAYIDFIEVSEDLKRQGIGRQLVKALKAEYPKIEWGYTTPAGAALKKAVKRLGAFDLKTAPLWEITPSMYLSKMNIHEPWIAEIAPAQYARLSKRGKAEYDKKRSAEWGASAKGKQEWADKVWEAYKNGEFSPDDPGVSKEAKSHIFYEKRELEKLDKKSVLDKIRDANTIKNFNQLNVGDRVWSMLTRDYYTVVKVNDKSVRLQSEALYKPFGKGEPKPMIRTTKYHDELRRLSPDEEEEIVEKSYIPYQYTPPAKKATQTPKKLLPEQTSFTERSQMTLFGRLPMPRMERYIHG